MHVRKATLGSLLLLVLAGCGGGGPSTSVLPQSGPAGAPTTTNDATIALPITGGYGGTMTLAATVPSTAITVTSSTTASSTARKKQSGTLSEFFYVTMVPKVTLTLPGLPSFNLSFRSTYPIAGKHFYYGLQVPASTGVYQQYRTEGPGLVSGSSVFFGASFQPYTITAGRKYTFVFYADSNGATVGNLLFVGNGGSTGITAYPVTATGNTPPVRTISGSNTGIANLEALAADVDGDLVVANVASTGLSSSIETFAEGANGNVAPIRSFQAPGFVTQVALDPINANIYVAYGLNGGPPVYGQPEANAVSTYSSSGVLLRTIYPEATVSGSGVGYAITGLTVDKRGALIVGGENILYNGNAYNCAIQVFAAGAKPSTPPTYVIAFNGVNVPKSDCATTAYRRSVDHVLTLAANYNLLEFENNASGTVVRSEYSQYNAADQFFQALTTDLTGDQIFAASSFANSVIRLAPSGPTFVVEPYLIGTATGLIRPAALAVGTP